MCNFVESLRKKLIIFEISFIVLFFRKEKFHVTGYKLPNTREIYIYFFYLIMIAIYVSSFLNSLCGFIVFFYANTTVQEVLKVN